MKRREFLSKLVVAVAILPLVNNVVAKEPKAYYDGVTTLNPPQLRCQKHRNSSIEECKKCTECCWSVAKGFPRKHHV